MRALLALALLLAAATVPTPALALWNFLYTMGIASFWDMERTKEAFTRAGIPEYDFRDSYDAGALGGKGGFEKMMTRKTAQKALGDLKATHFADDPSFQSPMPECLYYRNGLEQREDVRTVSVCFIERKYQITVNVFFRDGKTGAAALRQTLTEQYGKHDPDEEDVWRVNPGIYGTLLTTKIIVLHDVNHLDPEAVRDTGISAVVNYINTPQIAEFVNDKKAELAAAAKEEAEKAKQERSKGL